MNSPSKATAVAHPNLALVKYWGKRDESLILPHQSSLSVTLAPLEVLATVEWGGSLDEVAINGRSPLETERERVLATVEPVRAVAGGALGAVRVETRGNFPPAAGLASSAAAFAAIAVAARAAAGLAHSVRDASQLARLGSGSACRSIRGGTCIWRRGTRADGSDSFAEQIFDERHWPELRLLAALFSEGPKEVSSREGMRRTVETSPYYSAWSADAEAEVIRAAASVRERDLHALGRIAERSAWRMHAAALAADPALCYLRPATLELILHVQQERAAGVPVWFTLDAGPNPFILTEAAHEDEAKRIALACGAREVLHCWPGGDARLISEHLF
ncbi:MAG TPA: diphosphomevalonate decarboxylase [Myxococcaceae bacterium]|nr:diphosphomevalonate decarboxylase [Myxococcaceae bacterium]